MKIETHEIHSPLLNRKKIHLYLKRIDKIYSQISGNKWFKLKYYLYQAKKEQARTLLTFGGAYSNHIAATAYAAKLHGFKSIGIIRGEEHVPLNPTLRTAKENGMYLSYCNRQDYRKKHENAFKDKLYESFGNFYLIPEGGTSSLAIQGTSEILDENDTQDFICCAVGTGGTLAGIINSQKEHQQTFAFPALKDSSQVELDVKKWVYNNAYRFIKDYSFRGYGKVDNTLITFINNFYLTHGVILDAIYTGKMLYGIMDLIAKDFFPKGSSILAIHTGGIQGNRGFAERLGIQLPLEE
jgi:1-aminocyclopropane-1-carboxylate deaminase